MDFPWPIAVRVLRWVWYLVVILIVTWVLEHWWEFERDTAFLGGMCAVGFMHVFGTLGTTNEDHIRELWEYIWDPEHLKQMKASTHRFQMIDHGIRERHIRKGMTSDQIVEYLHSHGIKDVYLIPSTWEAKSETYDETFWNYSYADPTPINPRSIPEIRLIFRTHDKTLVDWGIKYGGNNTELIMRLREIMELRKKAGEGAPKASAA